MRLSNEIQTIFLVGFLLVFICQAAAASPEGTASDFSLSPDRAYLGFSMGLEQLEEGLQAIRVVRPVANSPAVLAGVQDGDLVTAINGEPVAVSDLFDLLRKMDTFKAGEVIQLQILRGEENLTLDVQSTRCSPADLERLNRWFVMMESRRQAFSKSAMDSDAQCGDGNNQQDYASQRWNIFLRKMIRGSEPATLTVQRSEPESPLVFEVSPSSVKVPAGFVASDLPIGMRNIVEQLQVGDAISYRIESHGREFHIKPLGDLPAYIKP